MRRLSGAVDVCVRVLGGGSRVFRDEDKHLIDVVCMWTLCVRAHALADLMNRVNTLPYSV